MKLENKFALITGGNSGIGLATAQRFVREGATVAITGRNQATLDEAASELGPKALAVRADILEATERAALFELIKTRFGKLDIVFANAGVFEATPLAGSSEAVFDRVLRTNVTGAFLTVQDALPLLSTSASIILNGSALGVAGAAGTSAYAASKAGIRAITRVLASELSPRNIRVNAVMPGRTDTPIWRRGGVPEALVQKHAARSAFAIPLARSGTPDEIAKAVLFLASDDAAYLQGAEIVIDGGLTGAPLGAPVFRLQ